MENNTTMPLKQAVQEISKLKFSDEQKKATREHLQKVYVVKLADRQ
jgi:hypothetical protein